MKLQAFGENIVVIRDPVAKETQSGIILPDNGKKPTTGEVESLGKAVKGVTWGDKVAFSSYAGTDIEVEGKTYTVIASKDILCTIN